jgi:hypothetical protein
VFQVKKLAWEHYSGIIAFILPPCEDWQMQKFSGVYVGKRRKQTGEAEAEMEGSGEDSEPQILAGIAKDLQRSIELSQSDLVNHLQEN